MTTYVLLGGAWLGGWAWQGVARRLRARGHDVYPLTLSGLGERVHLGSAATDLETHLADVVNVLRYEDLREVVLAGHSYAGIVVEGVADRAPERLTAAVYVDSAPLGDGVPHIALYPDEARTQMERDVAERGDGWRLPFPGVEGLGRQASLDGLDGDARALLEERATPHPFGTYLQPLRLTGRGAAGCTRAVIACNDFRALRDAGVPQITALAGPGWLWRELETGHWPMLSDPDGLAAHLHDLAPPGPPGP
jgi:pimeloyl-ACP methyl ester carboxylesterase